MNDMLLRLRERLSDKLNDGYVPLVGDIGGLGDLSAATNEIGMLQFYSERHMNEVVYEALRQWRRERAEAYRIPEDELEEHYRQRSLLKRSVLPEDIAEAVCFFASDRSAKSTGNILNVDAGNAGAFTR